MDQQKGQPTGSDRDARHIEGGKGGGVWKGTDVTERAPQIRNSGAERDTG